MALPTSYLAEFSEAPGYLEFASIGPVSRRVRARSDEAFANLHEPRGSVVEYAIGAYNGGRETIAAFLGTEPDRVTILPSTSAGLFQVAFGLTGGNVVLASHEFPANVYPWLRAADRGGPKARFVDVADYRLTPENLAAAVDADTVALAVSLVDFRTGFRADLAALRELAGDALLVVDAIQGFGAVDFAVDAADVLVTGGQKWLRAGWGAGIMALGPRALERLAPTLTGWYGVDAFLDTEAPPPHPELPTAERFQEGSPVLFGAVAAGAAVELVAEVGIKRIEEAVLERITGLEDVVRAAGAEVLTPWRRPEERAGIMCFRLPGESSAATAERLRAAELSVSERGTWIRLAPHASTAPEAAEMLRAAI